MTRMPVTHANPVPGAGTIFALRAIGLVLLARWLHAMAEIGYGAAFSAMTSSPWACVNIVFLFLAIVLPGAHARAERPLHPLPQWLRQALRFFGFLGLIFAVWSIGLFVWAAGGRRTLNAIADTNGWLVVAPSLYAAVVWICRPRALWRTNVAARRFAVGRYAISLDPLAHTVVVWAESRKVGQYDARELSLKWPAAAAIESEPVLSPANALHATGVAASTQRRDDTHRRWPGRARRSHVELLWDSPAAVGHNRQVVFRATLATDGDRRSAHALDAALRQI